MNKMIVAVFDGEAGAYEGLSALRDLHMEGSLTLYSTGVVAKDADGNTQIKQAADKGPIGTLIGIGTGTLIGVLAGPIVGGAAAGAALVGSAAATAASTGALAGMSVGAMTGIFVDVNEAGVDMGFVDEVADAIKPGTTAVLAEIDEIWMAPLDTRMQTLGGLVFRRLRSEVADDQFAREAEALNRELDQIDAELTEAVDDAKAALTARAENTRNRIKALNEATKAKLDKTVAEGKAKVAALQEQIKTAHENRKAKMEKRLEELKADYKERQEKLQRAWEITRDALA